MNTSAPEAGAAVRFPVPPLLFLVPLAVALAVHAWVLPWGMTGRPVTLAVGIVLTALGAALMVSGVIGVLRHRTTIVPHRPVSALVVDGPYRITRNPMYLGLAVAYCGVSFWAGTWWPLILAPLSVLATDRLVIRPEEDYLQRRFGEEYGAYRSRVRRWL